MEALKGKVMTTGPLSKASGYSSAEIFRAKGGMAELEAAGLVVKCEDGFYRVDDPPPDLRGDV